jgi:acyl-coenzyme A thioesterase PaaI-like protein
MQQGARYWIDEILVKSPFARPLGLQVVAAEPDRVLLRLPFRADLATVGIVHGGAIAPRDEGRFPRKRS